MHLDGFEYFAHNHGQFTHLVFQGGTGPPILLMHELPGMTPECIAFANRLRDRGFKIYMPLFFGQPGKPMTMGRTVGKFFRICVSREFRVFARNESSPVVNWLRSLCRKIHTENDGAKVGAIGMCMTGGFVIPLMVEPSMMAPVASQPALPACMTAGCKKSLGVSPEDLKMAVERAQNGVPLYGFRFSHDSMSPKERFETLREQFGEAFHPFEIDSSPGNSHGFARSAHSVFTHDYSDTPGSPTREAFERLVEFFGQQLK